MRKLLFLIVLFLAAGRVDAGLVIGSGIAAFCSSCTPGDPADIMCDALGGTAGAYQTGCSWDGETETAGNTLTFAALSETFPCAHRETYALQLDSAADGNAYNTITVTGSTTLYATVYFKIVSENWDGENEKVPIFGFRSAADGYHAVNVSIKDVTDVTEKKFLVLDCRKEDDTYTNGVGATELSTGTWYVLGVRWISDDNCDIYVSEAGDAFGSAEKSYTGANVHAVTIDQVMVGQNSSFSSIGATDTSVIQLYGLKVDATDKPDPCT